MTRFLVATIREWNIDFFTQAIKTQDFDCKLISNKEELTLEFIAAFKPDYVFFPHWSWRVPDEILNATECVCFHMTDVPFGRGGTPLQNLIQMGYESTVISALRMVPDMDAGPVYLKRPLSLVGRAQEIYERAMPIILEMMWEISHKRIVPQPQQGEATLFPRRKPEHSLLPQQATLRALYDHIRMLDAKSYPLAFLEHGDFRLEFTHAKLLGSQIEARVVIKPRTTE